MSHEDRDNLAPSSAGARSGANLAGNNSFPWTRHLASVQAAIESENDVLAQGLLAVLMDIAKLVEVEPATQIHLLARSGYLERRNNSWDEAKQRYLDGLTLAAKNGLSDHPSAAFCLDGLADCYQQAGQFDQAEPLRRQAVVIAEKTLGGEHPDTDYFRRRLNDLREQRQMNSLGNDLNSTTLFDKLSAQYDPDAVTAEPEAEDKVEANIAGFMWDKFIANGKKELSQKNLREAESHFRAAVDRALTFTSGHARTCDSLHLLAALLHETGRTDEAIQNLEQALTIAFKSIQPNSLETAKAMEALGDLFLVKDEPGLAKNYYTQSMNAYKYCSQNDSAEALQQKLLNLIEQLKEAKKWRDWSV